MKKFFIRIAAAMLAMLSMLTGGVGVYADDGIMPAYYLTNEVSFGITVGAGYAVFDCYYVADEEAFDHAELEMKLEKKGLIFWGDVDIRVTEYWIYEAYKSFSLRQEIPDATGKYRATYTLRVVGSNGTDTIEDTVYYTYN